MAKASHYSGFSFDAQAGQTLNYSTADNICVWIFTPDNQILTASTLPQSGKYTIQISAPKGNTTYQLALSLATQSPAPDHSTSDSPQLMSLQSAQPQVSVETEDVYFQSGSTGTSIEGSVNPSLKKRYHLQCGGGQSMTLLKQSGNINLSIIAPDGTTIGSLTSDRSQWQGSLPNDGIYILEISAPTNSSYAINVEVL
jgi:hypothetical protein